MNSLDQSFEKNSTDTIAVYRPRETDQPFLWTPEYIIANLPPWVYKQNPEPKSLEECDATICKLEHTIEDIELQIHIRQFEQDTGIKRSQSKYEHDKWVVQALRAKQTHKYQLSAYQYWRIINRQKARTESSTVAVAAKLGEFFIALCELLKNEPASFEEEIQTIKQKVEDYVELLVQY